MIWFIEWILPRIPQNLSKINKNNHPLCLHHNKIYSCPFSKTTQSCISNQTGKSSSKTNNNLTIKMQSHRQQIYKTYIFQHHNNIMFFHYNVNHPIMTKNITFELGNVNIFVGKQYYTCKITSKPCLAPNEDWS